MGGGEEERKEEEEKEGQGLMPMAELRHLACYAGGEHSNETASSAQSRKRSALEHQSTASMLPFISPIFSITPRLDATMPI